MNEPNYDYMDGVVNSANLCAKKFGWDVTEMALRQFGIENGGVVSMGNANAFILFAHRWLNPARPFVADPNAAMIARDGVALKATTVALPATPLTTAHPAIKGLSFLGPIGHLVDPAHLLKN